MVRYSVLIVLILLIGSGILFGQDFKDEMKAQVPVVLKALNYNKTLQSKMKDNCVIAVLYNPQSEDSEFKKEVIMDVLDDNDDIKIFKKKIKLIEIPMDNTVRLEKNIIIKKINAFWLSSDLDGYVPSIRESARYNQVITLSGEPSLLNNAQVVLGAHKTAGGPEIVFNLQEAQSMNLEISSELLSSATQTP